MILVLCKTLSGLIYGVISLFAVLFFSPKRCLQLAVVIALLVGTYPFVRGAGLIPIDDILEAARDYEEDRANSLGLRFRMEDLLMAKANERPLFGWGGSGRSRVYDPITGNDVTISDGAWIIFFGDRR